jgi:transcriptional regulator with XRE-family HTH domain
LGFGLNLRFVHLLSKDARRRVVEVMLSGRSLRELSELLGITPAAISKYRSGVTHPSDEVLGRILEGASRVELEEIAKVAFNDLYLGFENLIEWMLERRLVEGSVLEKLRKLVERVESDPEVKRARIIIR